MSEISHEPTAQPGDEDKEPPRPPLSPAAQRALAEAAERRRLAEIEKRPKEINGQDGPEPTRYGDWEKGGIISDF